MMEENTLGLRKLEGGEDQMEQEMLSIPKYICKKCGHVWISRITGRPVQCPKCKRTDWDKPSNKENGK